MKRLLLESGLAASIFFAANAVYGIDALMGGNLAGAREYATALVEGPKNLQVRLGEIVNMRLPAPVSLDLANGGEHEHSFCLAPQFGREQVSVRVPSKDRALMSDTVALPYQLDIVLGSKDRAASGDELLASDCHGKSNVRVRVSLDDSNLSLVRNRAFTDTVVLVVDPE
ncbi:MAG TPA: hypothetical protein VJ998_12400 [Pseudomonadales bacterium]|nr:hypothetical protein [Pseudomonadales bacterium]